MTLLLVNTKLSAQTVSSLWNEYVSNPYNHPNIPNNSYAGYGTGITPIPNPSITPINVTASPYNAVPNDNTNDQPAIQAAINAAGAAGGGIVYLPAGTYRLDKPIYIKYSNVIVRGQGSTGSTATILDFKFSMYSMYKADIDASNNKGCLWWSTGLVWMGPTDAFKSNGAPNLAGGAFEDWRHNSTLATVTKPSNLGTFSVTVDNASPLSAGMKVDMRYRMPTDRSFIKHIYGHAATASGIDNDSYVGNCNDLKSPVTPNYHLPVLIKSVSGNTITFDRPLRIKVDPSLWLTTISDIQSIVTESGLENVQIKGYNTSKMAHLPTPTSTTTPGAPTLGGWNGVYIDQSWNCWVNNVRFVNLECGVIFACAKNCSVLNTFITSTSYDHWYHHPYTFRSYSSDNLVENFTIDGPSRVMHGISAERFSSGNVYSKGLMKVGTFDAHRGAAFDLIKTEITVANDAGSFQGGASSAGPYSGKRNVNWNIIQKIQSGYTYLNSYSHNGDNIYEPLQYPMGAFVAITGPKDETNGEFVPPPPSGGNLGSRVVTESITDETLFNLYHAELALRKGTLGGLAATTVKITSPVNNTTYTAPATIKFHADVLNADATINKVEFYKGSTLFHTENITPYEFTVGNMQSGSYTITAKATDNNGKVTTSAPVAFSVISASRSLVKEDQPVSSKEPLSLNINPNPVANILNISIQGLQTNNRSAISVLSVSGAVIKTIQPVALNKQVQLDVSSLSGGVYFIKVINGDRILYKQFLKL